MLAVVPEGAVNSHGVRLMLHKENVDHFFVRFSLREEKIEAETEIVRGCYSVFITVFLSCVSPYLNMAGL
ncbi:hypothetical protein E2C01_081194 [Portunus trituberculatus]|uniref:Uncharacterized protein n=1 Tax=Portunus trituberculatus TaxID=210409 RepID=A0A5B7IVZ6_PORTR|nr:hypothetical protein [Portunus trituberculatus]